MYSLKCSSAINSWFHGLLFSYNCYTSSVGKYLIGNPKPYFQYLLLRKLVFVFTYICCCFCFFETSTFSEANWGKVLYWFIELSYFVFSWILILQEKYTFTNENNLPFEGHFYKILKYSWLEIWVAMSQ